FGIKMKRIQFIFHRPERPRTVAGSVSFDNPETVAGCSLSPRERVRVRGPRPIVVDGIKCFVVTFVLMASVFVASAANLPSIIPAPQKMELRDGTFQLTAETKIYVDSESRETGE